MLLATPERFEDPDGWYWPPMQDYSYYPLRASQIRGRWASGKILVAGCGYGYLVAHLVSLGADAWGCDASSYAINKGKQLLPAIANRLLVADVTVSSQVTSVRQAAGLPGNQRFTGIVTEDLLPCLNAGEVVTALGVLRANVQSGAMAHIITPYMEPYSPDHGQQHPEMLWRTLAQWRTVIGPGDPILNAVTLAEAP